MNITSVGSGTSPDVSRASAPGPVLVFLVTEDWYFVSHRLWLARRAIEAGYDVTVVTRVTNHGREICDAGCEVIPLDWRRRNGGVWRELRALLRIVRIYRTLRPAIVHHVALKPVLYGSLAAVLAGARKVVNEVAGFGRHVIAARSGESRVLRRALGVGLRMASLPRETKMILQNPDDRDLLLRTGIVSSSGVVVIRGSGVDLTEFRPGPVAPDPPVVVMASRMIRSKGIGDFVEAARLLTRESVPGRFVLVGDTDPGNPAAIPRQRLAEWRDSGAVEWWGHRSDMPDVLARCHVVCLPTAYGEGVPKILLEAAASGKPIVATEAPGCREIVRHGENGFLVPVGDAAALARALRTLIEHPEMRAEMGARSRRIAEQEFSVEQAIEATLGLYGQMVGDVAVGVASGVRGSAVR